MADKNMNSSNEVGFLITESYCEDGKSFENIMQDIISQFVNSELCINHGIDPNIGEGRLSFNEQAKRSIKKCLT